MATELVPLEVEASKAKLVNLPGMLSVHRGFVAVPTQDIRAFAIQQAILLGAGFGFGMVVGFLLRRPSFRKNSGLSGTGVTKRINLFQQAIDRGNCRAAEGLIDRMGEERAVQMLRSMIQQYRGTCQG